MATYQPTFLYPRSRQFPFDEVCELIVRELELRNWQAPGLTVELDMYGSGEQRYRLVRYIRGEEFKLHFGRIQGLMPGGRWNNTAAVNDIVIPHKELNVYDDESGPTFYLYVGGDWQVDREKFMNGSKVNSKLHGEPKRYLEYKGGCDCPAARGLTHTHPGSRPPLLLHNNDLGREYDPEGDEPMVFRTSEVLEEFRDWLQHNVLEPILALPVPTEKVNMFVPPQAIPFPTNPPPLFTFVEWRDRQRIEQGQQDKDELSPADRYGLIGSGRRLVSYGIRNDGTVPEKAYDGFLWCGLGDVSPESSYEELAIPGFYRWDARTIVRVKPNRANDIYIADMAGQEAYRRKYFNDNPKVERLEGEPWYELNRIPGRTLVPITEYTGGYERPVVLVNRDLDFDELEIIGDLPRKDRY